MIELVRKTLQLLFIQTAFNVFDANGQELNGFAVSTCACVCMDIKSRILSLWCPITSPMYQQAAPHVTSDSMTQATRGDVFAKSRK